MKETEQIIEYAPFGSDDRLKLSVEMVKRLIAVKTRSGKTASDEDAFKFIMLCQARRLNPFEGDAYLIGYDGQQGATFSLITSHQAFLKRAELHPQYNGMESGVIVLREGAMVDLVGDFHLPNDQVLGGWATVYFKGREFPMRKRLRLSRFNKGFGVWKEDPAGMICKCAEADALRSSFPTMLGGLYIEQETRIIGETEIAKPVFDTTTTTVEAEPPPAAPAPEPKPVEPPKEPPPPKTPKKAPPATSQEPKKKETSSGVSATNGRSTPKLKPKDRSLGTDQPNHAKLLELVKIGGFGSTDLIAVALDNGWIDLSEASWEKLTEEKCAMFLESDNWAVIMEQLEKRGAQRAEAPETLDLK